MVSLEPSSKFNVDQKESALGTSTFCEICRDYTPSESIVNPCSDNSHNCKHMMFVE